MKAAQADRVNTLTSSWLLQLVVGLDFEWWELCWNILAMYGNLLAQIAGRSEFIKNPSTKEHINHEKMKRK